MNKDELRKYSQILSDFHSEFSLNEMKYKNGKNKSIREVALKDCYNVISNCELYIRKNSTLYSFITSEDSSSYHRTINWNEFFSFNFFKRDLGKVIEKMRNIIREE